MISVKGLTKQFGDWKAIDDISFEVNKGEVLGFLGQNGAGKTTTMKILTTFMPATEGDVTIDGLDIFENPYEVKQKIGYLPENPPLYPELCVGEYLSFIAELRGIPAKKRPESMDRVLEKLSITDVRHRLVGNLSKGYRQRVGLAQALIHDPQVLIMDEPTIGLDPKQISEARELIRSFRKERTVIYSTHILSEVAATCDRIIIIDKGKIVAQESLHQDALEGGVKQRMELGLQKLDDTFISELNSLEGISQVEVTSQNPPKVVFEWSGDVGLLAEISSRAVQKQLGVVHLMPIQMTLEQHYLEVIGGKGVRA